MRHVFFLLCTILLLWISACTRAERSSEAIGTPYLFDGSSFEGWEGDLEFFRIEDGSIVAGALDRPIPGNRFLCTEATFSDFELILEVKFVSRENNAGIQIRSARIPNDHEVIGYQSDVGYAGDDCVWGSLYDESRRNRFLAKANPEVQEKVIKTADWNTYKIRCQENRIQHWINNVQILDYLEEDESIADQGVICLQIHGGKAAEAWYRHIRLQTL